MTLRTYNEPDTYQIARSKENVDQCPVEACKRFGASSEECEGGVKAWPLLASLEQFFGCLLRGVLLPK